MASPTAETTDATLRHSKRIQRRHTIAAVVYFLYGLFYLFGAQYITRLVESTGRGATNSGLCFVLGGVSAGLLSSAAIVGFSPCRSRYTPAAPSFMPHICTG